MKVVLVPVADRPECAKALETTFAVARAVDGNVIGCHMRPHEDERSGGRLPRLADSSHGWEAGSSLDSDGAEELFNRLAEANKFERVKRPPADGRPGLAMWREMLGSPDRLFAIVGPLSDLTVVSRPKRKTSLRARAFMQAALMRSGSATLVVPNKSLRNLHKHVLIAWNQAPEAAAAVTAALPLMMKSESVTIVVAGKDNLEGPKARHLQDYLRNYGISAKLKRTRGRYPAEEIGGVYQEAGASLVVMGAYHRRRWREILFGGVTEAFLTDSSMPLLMVSRQG